MTPNHQYCPNIFKTLVHIGIKFATLSNIYSITFPLWIGFSKYGHKHLVWGKGQLDIYAQYITIYIYTYIYMRYTVQITFKNLLQQMKYRLFFLTHIIVYLAFSIAYFFIKIYCDLGICNSSTVYIPIINN